MNNKRTFNYSFFINWFGKKNFHKQTIEDPLKWGNFLKE